MAARYDRFVGRTYARYVQGDSSYSASRRQAAFKAVAQSREKTTREAAPTVQAIAPQTPPMTSATRKKPGPPTGTGGRPQLTRRDVELIRQDSRSLAAIAREYGVGRTTIWNAKHRVSYKHVP
jgi:hypothetical protein